MTTRGSPTRSSRISAPSPPSTSYPSTKIPSTQREVLEEFWPALLEAMLAGWVTDEELWPKNRTLEMFREWFEVQVSSVVQDLHVDQPLEYFDKPRSLKGLMARLVGRVFG